MLSLSLELPEFKVIKHEKYSNNHLVSVEKNTLEERCIHWGFLSSTVHDRRTRKVRDLPLFKENVYLLIHVKRYKCLGCLEVFSERYESVLLGKHQTNRLREHLYQLYLDTTIQYVSLKMNIPYTTLERIFYSIAQEKAMEHQETLSKTMKQDHLVLSLDEVAVRKGHQYETVLMDAQLGCVLGMVHQRTTESTKQLLNQNVLSKEAVHTVVMDMWEPFHKAVKSMLPTVTIVVDKYHVIQKVTQALDKVRKKHSNLKKVRYLFLKGYEN